MKRSSLVFASLVALAPLAVAGCSKQAKPKAPAPEARAVSAPAASAKRAASTATGVSADGSTLRFGSIYFDYDSDTLRPESRETLQSVADALQSRSDMRLVVEGHADDRGTDEYNVALGERRANAIRDYLVRLGIQSSRLRVISYGEERPAVAGKGESAWEKNRRGEFVPQRN